jgi:hypothetical protein|tara:strand:+ start:76 stop:2562 length:2487 start_codon:yes stop_codon:yes gene_type:complete
MALPPSPMGSLVDTGAMQGGPDDMLPSVEVPMDMPEDFSAGAEVIQNADGSATVQSIEAMIEEAESQAPMEHEANLAEFLDDGYMGELSSELRSSYEEDQDSRSDWEEAYTKGLDQLGIRQIERTEPFQGASGVTHPLIAESVTQFQAQAYKELLPAGGPVQTQVLGKQDADREAQAHRVKTYMNYQIMEVMDEYDPDMDQLLFYLPLSGSTFKKVYFDESKQRSVSKFIPAQDLVVPYSASDLNTASRVTHVLRMDFNQIRKMQVAGFYRDIELQVGDTESDEVRQKVDEIQGLSKTYTDEVYTLLEMHVDLDLEGFEDMSPDGEPTGIQLPYIVTLDEASGDILSVRRNYDEGTELAKKRQYFVHYKFMPGLGFYGFGLIHMIGGLGRAATSILRQLIDAGTLANLPAGFKARGVKVRNDDEPLQPGEWRDIDAPGGNIRDSIIPLPYKEPSATLAQLLGALIEGGRRFVSLADEQTNNMNQETPVGTTMAMLERGMKVMSAIHKRLHYAQKTEFRILARTFADNLPQEYPYDVAGAERTIMATDFDGRVDIIPVSDPNIFSMAQRVTLAQTQLQLAQSNPQMHNLHAAYRRMYMALEVQNIDEILPPPPQPQPLDPALENARALMGELLQSFPDQDHDAHIKIHVMFMKTPLVTTSPQVMGTFYAHLLEHIGMKARLSVTQEIENLIIKVQEQVQMGNVDPNAAQQQIAEVQQNMQNPAEMEKLVAIQQLEIMQETLADLIPPGQDAMADPLVQIRMQELQIKKQDADRKASTDKSELLLEAAKMEQRAVTDAARIESSEDIAGNRNDVNRERIEVQRQGMNRRG